MLLEAERVRAYGFLDSELDRAKRDVLSYFENFWKQRDDMESVGLRSGTSWMPLRRGDFYPSVDWQWKAVTDLLPGITLDEVTEVGNLLLGESNRVVIVNGPSVPAITDLTRAGYP